MEQRLKNVLIYESIFDMTEDLTDEEVGLLFKGINTWRKGGEVEFEDRLLKGIWMGILPNLKTLEKNYDKKANANRENGKKGGRPKKTSKTSSPTVEVNVPEVEEEVAPKISETPQLTRVSFESLVRDKVIDMDTFDVLSGPTHLNCMSTDLREFTVYMQDQLNDMRYKEYNGLSREVLDNIKNKLVVS